MFKLLDFNRKNICTNGDAERYKMTNNNSLSTGLILLTSTVNVLQLMHDCTNGQRNVYVTTQLRNFNLKCDYNAVIICFSPLVIGAIIICLFPLWPAQMREYTWYVSVAAAILLGALIVVALCKWTLNILAQKRKLTRRFTL